jgi:hypothetical protein
MFALVICMGNSKFTILTIVMICSTQTGAQSTKPQPYITIESEYRVAAAKYGVGAKIFKALLIVESDLNHKAVNPLTMDFGIGQINYRTAEAYNIDISRLTHDRAYSIDRAAFVLSKFQKTFKAREPATWVCRYNIGYQSLPARCAEYNRRIKLAMELL